MLDLSLGLMLLVAVIFIFLIYILDKILYTPLLNFMNNREKSIKSDLERAKYNSSNAEHLIKEREDIILEAKVKAHKMKEEAINKVKMEIEEKIEAKKSELENSYETFLTELEKERDEISTKISEALPSFNNALKSKISQI